MSFKNVIMSSAAALVLLSGTANANQVSGTTEIEIDGTGDYLLFPTTWANNDWQTDLKVVNTNTTHAVVARVVIRRGDTSEEIFDFPIYLTPGDVWEGTLQKGANSDNLVVLTSDDSAMLWDGQHILHADDKTKYPNGMEITGPKAAGLSTDKYLRATYVEVFGLADYNASMVPNGQFVQHTPKQAGHPLMKTPFFQCARDVVDGTVETDLTKLKNLYECVPGIVSDVTDEDLMGKQTIFSNENAASGKRSMIYDAKAFSYFAGAPRMTDVVGSDTALNNMSDRGSNVVSDLETAYSKVKIYAMYEEDEGTLNPMRVIFTDPVKKYHYDELNDINSYYNYASLSTKPGMNYYYNLSDNGRDMEENVSSCIPKNDVSDISQVNPDAAPCDPRIVNTEIYYRDYGNAVGKLLDNAANSQGLKPNEDYRFPSGGYLTFFPDANETDHRHPMLIPTQFSAKYIGGTGLNNHIDLQNLEGED